MKKFIITHYFIIAFDIFKVRLSFIFSYVTGINVIPGIYLNSKICIEMNLFFKSNVSVILKGLDSEIQDDDLL